MAQSFDPFGLVGRAVDAARLGLDVYSWTEQQIVGALRKGLNELEPEVIDDDVVPAAPKAKPADADESLNSKMSQLLNRALDQNTAGSQTELYHHLLDQLVADEARIVGALSDGSVSPLVNVYDRTRKAVLEEKLVVITASRVSGSVGIVRMPDIINPPAAISDSRIISCAI